MHHEERHVVSNVIGVPDMQIEIGSTIKRSQRDTLLLASDGLFDNLHTGEIISRIRKGPLPVKARALVMDIQKRMSDPQPGQPSKADDVTFIAFWRQT